MVSNTTITQVNSEDLVEVAPLFDQYRMFYEQASDLSGAYAFLQERLLSKESILYIARNESGDAVGFTQLYPSFSSVSMKRVWILNDLYVIPQARHTGVAKRLLEAAQALAIQTEAKGISLSTANDNYLAQHLYEAFGYKKDKDFLSYFLTL
jgi:ribosomal protein S18 acetylase RimI-like enzyme